MSISSNMLPNRMDLYRYDLTSNVPDDLGGYSRAAVLVVSGIPCNIQYLTGKEQILYGKNNIPAEYKIFCNNGLNGANYIETTDLIYAVVSGVSKWFNILFIDNSCILNDHLRIFVKCTEAPQIVYPDSSSSESSSSSSYIENWSSSSSSSSESSSSSSGV